MSRKGRASAEKGRASAGARILSTAAALFAQFGYNGVSTRDIAFQAAVNEVTIYRHHRCKRDLYLAVLEVELSQVSLRGDSLAKIAGAPDGRAVLDSTFELIVTMLAQNPRLFRLLLYSALDLGDDVNVLLRKHVGELVEAVARYLDPWIETGDLRAIDGKSLLLTLIAIVLSHRSLHRVFSNGAVSLEVLSGAYVNICAL
jgi:AcrR family transcriptional regulator